MHVKTHCYRYSYSHFKHEEEEVQGVNTFPESISRKTRIRPSCESIMPLPLAFSKAFIWGVARVAQSIKRQTSARVTISQIVGSSPASGSVLSDQSLEPASESMSPSLSAPPLLTLCLSLSQK